MILTSLVWFLAPAVLIGTAVWTIVRTRFKDTARPDLAFTALEFKELDRLKNSGALMEDDWRVARAEAGRRCLATVEDNRGLGFSQSDRVWVNLAIAATVIASVGAYRIVGEPGNGDKPYEARVLEWTGSEAPLNVLQMAAVLELEVRRRPSNREMRILLGSARYAAGDFVGAISAFRQALVVNPEDPASWSRLGESLVAAQKGRASEASDAAFQQAFKRDPDQVTARYFLGLAALERSDQATARDLWRPLIGSLDPEDP